MKISDLHTHPSFKPFHNRNEKNNTFQNMWNGVVGRNSYFYKVGALLRGLFKETARDSQSNLNEFISGDLQTACVVVHPIERGWFFRPDLKKRLIHRLLVRLAVSKGKLKFILASMTGIPLESASRYFDEAETSIPVDYYQEDTYPEYDYMAQQEGSKATWDHEYIIVKDHTGYQAAKNAGKIPLFLSIEGGHALINLTENKMLHLEYDELSQDQIEHIRLHLKKNIERVKGQGDDLSFKPEHTPIYLTLSHMYQNFLAGHSRTYMEGGIGPDIADLLDQEVGMNAGLTELGREAIDLLISDQNGSRILIDVKHLSVRGRKDYYQIARQHNLPIIASHVAMAGVEDFVDNPKDSRKDQKKNYFSRWSINLSDLDARFIHESDGIIGIALHEGRMPGGQAKKRIKKIKKKIRKGHELEEILRFQYLKLTMGNIFQIILAIGEKEAWTRIMIGSDYDGIMNPFDIYPKTSSFQRFIYDMEKFLENPKPITVYRGGKETTLSATEIKDHMFGFTPNQIAKMIAIENFENFIQRHF